MTHKLHLECDDGELRELEAALAAHAVRLERFRKREGGRLWNEASAALESLVRKVDHACPVTQIGTPNFGKLQGVGNG